jgi:transposase
VVDVPPKLSAQVRVFATGNGRKTDPVDAHSIAMVALRTPNLVRVEVDPDLVVLGMLVDRRDALGRGRTQTINRLHRLLLELFPGYDRKIKAVKKELKELVIARGSTLQDLHGIGPSSSARLLADVARA